MYHCFRCILCQVAPDAADVTDMHVHHSERGSDISDCLVVVGLVVRCPEHVIKLQDGGGFIGLIIKSTGMYSNLSEFLV